MEFGAGRRWLLVCTDVRPSDLLPRLGHRADGLRVLEIGPEAGDGGRAVRGLGRRRPRGVLLALPAAGLAGREAAARLLDRLAPLLDRLRERHGRLPAILLLTHDALPHAAEPLGGFGGTPAGTLQEALRQAACSSLDAIASRDGAPPPFPMGRLAGEVRLLAEGAGAVLDPAGLDFAGAFLVPAAAARREEDLLPATALHGAGGKAAARRRAAYPAAAVLLAAAVGMFSWSQLRSLEGRVATLGAALAPAAAATGSSLSPVALAALGEMAALTEDGGLRLPLLPASWSGAAEETVRYHVGEKVADILVAPVRRRMEEELKEIEAGLAVVSSFSRAGTTPQVAALLDRLLDLAEQANRFRLQAGGSIREQWETLVAGPGSGPLPMAWLDTRAGRAGLGRAVARAPWNGDRLGKLAVLAVGMIGADLRETLRAEDAVSAIIRARDAARAAIGTLSRDDGAGDDAALSRAVAGLARSLSVIARQAERLSATADGAAAGFDTLEGRLRPALDAAGLVPSHVWEEIRHDMRRASRERDAALAEASLSPFGPLFEASATPAPALSRAAKALGTLVPLVEPRPVPRSDFAALAAGAGAPDPALLAQAADRFARRRAWMRDHAGALPAALARHLQPALDRRSAEAGLAALAAAYRPTGDTASGMPDPDGLARSAAALDATLAGLAATAPDRLGDAAWLAGVRAYRLLEAVDRRYERRNTFRFETAIRGWDGKGRILRGTAFRNAAALDALMAEGTRRLHHAAAVASPLLRTLGNDAVRAALPEPALAGKWHALIRTAGEEGDGKGGLDALRRYVTGTLGTFGRGDCGKPDRLPVVPESPEDPFDGELAAIRTALEESCGALLSAGMPLPGRKPVPDGLPEHASVSWQRRPGG